MTSAWSAVLGKAGWAGGLRTFRCKAGAGSGSGAPMRGETVMKRIDDHNDHNNDA
jgi:hypothetical protein